MSLQSGFNLSDINRSESEFKTPETGKYLQKIYNYQGKSLPYRIMFPGHFNPDSQYPILFFLHGAGERGNDNQSQLTHGSGLLKDSLDRYPAIVVFPQCSGDDYWADVRKKGALEDGKPHFVFNSLAAPGPSMLLLERLIDSLTAMQCVDQSRIYIAGLSMGGMGTAQLLAKRPAFFAAGIVICGAAPLNYAQQLAKTPAWIFHGKADPVVSHLHSKQYFEAIDDRSGKHQLTLYDKVGHASWEKAFKEPRLLKWLFSNQR